MHYCECCLNEWEDIDDAIDCCEDREVLWGEDDLLYYDPDLDIEGEHI